MDGLLIVLLLASGGYITACAAWPFSACGRCSGTGKRRSPSGRAWRPCGRCGGAGRRVRLGRRLWEMGRRDR